MKDYTISHACGLEHALPSLKEARADASKHRKCCHKCKEPVMIDEYDTEGGDMGGGELTGKYWEV